MKKFIILGVTGSIGTQTLDIIRENNFTLYAMSFHHNVELAKKIIDEFKPRYVCVKSQEIKEELSNSYKDITYFLEDDDGLSKISTLDIFDKDICLINALVGSIGLKPSYDAVGSGRDLYLANKETLVIGGKLINEELKKNCCKIIPIDSEHSAIYQLIKGQNQKEINRLYITASGGSFRDKTRKELENVTIEDALKHPNWSMGKKITIDCATMMNKGFELIEACYLFNLNMDQVKPIIHKESIIHSMVEFKDYSIFAQVSNPDMHLPIAYAIFGNHNANFKNIKPLDLILNNTFTFSNVDFKRYPMVEYAITAFNKGGYYPTILNASNEVAVKLFLDKKISFLEIEKIVKKELDNDLYNTYHNEPLSIDKIIELDNLIKKQYIDEGDYNS